MRSDPATPRAGADRKANAHQDRPRRAPIDTSPARVPAVRLAMPTARLAPARPSPPRTGWSRGRHAVLAHLLGAHVGHARLRRVLDVTCGTSGFDAFLREIADDVEEVDVELPRRDPFCPTRAALHRLPFPDATFDMVCMIDVLEHLDDDKRAVCEAFRVLRPGGLLCASVPAGTWLEVHHLRGASRRRYSPRGLRLLIARARLRVERLTHTDVALAPLLMPLMLARRWLARLRILRAAPRDPRRRWPLPDWFHSILERAACAELTLASRFDLPLGDSLMLIARRPQAALARRARRTRSRLAGVLRRRAA